MTMMTESGEMNHHKVTGLATKDRKPPQTMLIRQNKGELRKQLEVNLSKSTGITATKQQVTEDRITASRLVGGNHDHLRYTR